MTDQKAMHPVTKERMTAKEALEAHYQRALRTAMQSPQHLKAWLQESGRRYIVFDGNDMVDAFSKNWPFLAEEFQRVCTLYRDHRRKIPNGQYEKQIDPVTDDEVEVPLHKDEVLEPEELDRCIRYLVGQLRQTHPNWSLDDPAM